jgi:hypothetical protein
VALRPRPLDDVVPDHAKSRLLRLRKHRRQMRTTRSRNPAPGPCPNIWRRFEETSAATQQRLPQPKSIGGRRASGRASAETLEQLTVAQRRAVGPMAGCPGQTPSGMTGAHILLVRRSDGSIASANSSAPCESSS